jgi:phospholipase C
MPEYAHTLGVAFIHSTRTPTPMPPAAADAIDHIIILMMENRSFDHMLGALSLPEATGGAGRNDVDGLTGRELNHHEGRDYPVFRMANIHFADDPCHTCACVREQLAHKNGGFVSSFDAVRQHEDAGAIMGYLPTGTLPVFEFLVDNFILCDRWHCSVPGPTWPNRVYSLAGESQGQHDNHLPPGGFSARTIFEYLDDANVSWGYYAHDRVFSFLRVFRRFSASTVIRPFESFIHEAARGTLPSVVWLEPEFGTRPGSVPNDDHPPSDLANGQALIARVLTALRQSPLWERTLFILTYDEHGGFFDHVVPPAAADARADFRQYGLRVPAFVVSPLVEPGICSTIFDHTTILKTILQRFCVRSDGTCPSMGDRTDNAHSLWPLLRLERPQAEPAPLPQVTPAPGATQSNAASSRDPLLYRIGGNAIAQGVRDEP